MLRGLFFDTTQIRYRSRLNAAMKLFLSVSNAAYIFTLFSIATAGTAFFDCMQLSAQTSPITSIAHAHNDYEHERPLHDAMESGFTSVEADVYLIDDKLLVAHDRRDTTPQRTLQSLYLAPLRQHFKKPTNRSTKQTFWLMIDIKSDSVTTLQKIHEILQEYPDLIRPLPDLSQKQAGPQTSPVRVVISGNRAKDEILHAQPRVTGIDGRLADLQSDLSPQAMPWISDNWNSHFTWRGEGDFPRQERDRLRSYVRRAHQKGRLLRFWATTDSPKFWNELIDSGVDLINADELSGLKSYLLKRQQNHSEKEAAEQANRRSVTP